MRVRDEFEAAGFEAVAPSRQRKGKAKPDTVVVSFRVARAEKTELERRADGLPLGAYLRGVVFGRKVKAGKRVDHAALSRVLAALGRSGLAESLARLVALAEIGALGLNEADIAELRASRAEISALRRDLLRALRFKPGGAA